MFFAYKIKIPALLYILFCIILHKNHFSFFNLIYNFTCTVTTSTFGEGKSLNSVKECIAKDTSYSERHIGEMPHKILIKNRKRYETRFIVNKPGL